MFNAGMFIFIIGVVNGGYEFFHHVYGDPVFSVHDMGRRWVFEFEFETVGLGHEMQVEMSENARDLSSGLLE